MPETSAAIPRTRTNTPIVMRPLRIGLEHDGRAVSDDLAHGLADLGGIETHHDHGVSTHRGGIAHKPIDGMPARLFEKLRVFLDFAADERAKPRHDIAAEPTRTHDHSETLAQCLFDTLARYALRGDNEH